MYRSPRRWSIGLLEHSCRSPKHSARLSKSSGVRHIIQLRFTISMMSIRFQKPISILDILDTLGDFTGKRSFPRCSSLDILKRLDTLDVWTSWKFSAPNPAQISMTMLSTMPGKASGGSFEKSPDSSALIPRRTGIDHLDHLVFPRLTASRREACCGATG